MRHLIKILLASIFIINSASCVSSKKYKALNSETMSLRNRIKFIDSSIMSCNQSLSDSQLRNENTEKENRSLNKQVNELLARINYLKSNNVQVLTQLQNLSVISQEQAESIKQSMENLDSKDSYIQTLQQQIAYKDSLNMKLIRNLKGAIGDLDDKDINIKVDKGVVFIDISDRLLFKSGSYDITGNAKYVLGKVAKVLKNQAEIEFMVEGHTDNVPYRGNAILKDNWDLSVKRATTIVRLLQLEYGLDPHKIVAAGRSEYNPVDQANTLQAKARNRRTRIVILPELDQFFKILESN